MTSGGALLASSRDGGETLAGGAPPAPGRRLGIRAHPAWIAVIGCCAVIFHVAMAEGLNTDVFWHLAAGQWMLAHHSVIRHDYFSYTIRGRNWVADEWGFEVILAWTVAHVGPVAYWLLAALPCCAAVLLSALRWRRLGAQQLWMGALAIGASLALVLGVSTRPQVFSYAFVALELLILLAARQKARWLASLPVLMLLWANIHGSFLAGIAILALDLALSAVALRAPSILGPASRHRLHVSHPLPPRAAGFALAGSVIAACANPRGPYLYAYALKVSTSNKLANYIVEWQSPNFHSPLIFVAIAVPTVVAIWILATVRRRVELFDLILWIAFLVATLHAIRFVPYLGLVIGGLLAPFSPLRKETIRPTVLTPVLSICLCAAVLAGSHQPAGAPNTKGSGAEPVAGAQWLSHQNGRVFSTYAWNDYLIHVGIPVFVDGRTDLYFGTHVLSDYIDVEQLTTPPDPVLARYHVRWVLWPKAQPLSIYLSKDRSWRLVRTFGSAQVFEKVASAHQ